MREETMTPSAEKQHKPDPRGRVLLVGEDSEHLEQIRRITEGMGYSIHACNSYAEGVRQLESGAFAFVIVGQGSRLFEGRCVVERAIQCYLEAMQLGAVDYVAEPSVGAEIARVLHNHLPRYQS
jgi:CheY-like chemotaxis protein